METIVTIGATGFDAVHIGLLIGVLALVSGLFLVWTRAKQAAHDAARDLEFAEQELGSLHDEVEKTEQELLTQRRMAEDARIALAKAQAHNEEQEKRFGDMAQGAVRKAHSEFLNRADERFEKLIEPIAKNFTEFKARVETIEKVRTEDKSAIQEQVKAIGQSLHRNTAETGKLVNALTAPKGGGRWGEMTLRNVMEQAGLSAHCDFNEQVNDQTEEGHQRPDAVIHLPGGRQIVVDSKVSLEAYLAAAGSEDSNEKAALLKSHAANIQRHITVLASRNYQSNLDERVDFVAMFIPGENFFAAALEYAPDMLEKAYAKNVIVTTPSTLIGLAKTVSYVWRQEKMTENARQAAKLGEQLYERIATLAGHMEKLGKSLNGSVENYNRVMASLDKRILPTMRKFEDLSIAPPDKSMPEPKRIENSADSASRTPELDFAE